MKNFDIIKMVLSNNDDAKHKIAIACIVGMAGVGKITLTQLIYNDIFYNNVAVNKTFYIHAFLLVFYI